MNPYEKIQDLTNQRGISVRELEKRLGFSNGYFSKWKKVSPNSEGLQKVADYFGVSVDYLLGREEQTKKDPLTYYRMDTSGMTEDQIKILREKLEFAERIAREDIRRTKGD